MFVESDFGNPALLDRPHLHESMGQFLQKTNIIRDVREDFDDGRKFWPREIWSKHVGNFEDLFKPENKQLALNCQSEMVLNALNHADECLFYLAGLREQSVFNFCAIPQAMAIATLELCFQNYAMFERNIKITKGTACQLMIDSTQNLQLVTDIFRKHIRAIRKKNRPQDPNFLKISIACGKVEQFIESIFPTQKLEDAIAKAKGQETSRDRAVAEAQAKQSEATGDTVWLLVAVFVVLAIISGTMVSPFFCHSINTNKYSSASPGSVAPVSISLSTKPPLNSNSSGASCGTLMVRQHSNRRLLRSRSRSCSC
jgi:farnesyl-diphosphate farnesyltransferase